MKMSPVRIFMGLALGLVLLGPTACVKNSTAPPEAGHTASPGAVTLNGKGGGLAAGIKTEKARRLPFSASLRATGTVGFDQTAYAFITARVPGRIEKVLAYGGEKVRSGQELLSLYSPEFLTAQLEYLQADNRVLRQVSDTDPDGPQAARQMRDSSASRLRLMGLTQDELTLLSQKQLPQPLLSVRAPFSGSVVESWAVAGSWLEAGDKLATVADLSRVWVMIDIFEKDLGLVRPGLPVTLRAEAYPSETFQGRLALISDTLDSSTRTAKGRVVVPNPGGRLKPGMFLEARLTPSTDTLLLVVPEAAVRQVEGKTAVFVPQADGQSYRLKEVRTGRVFHKYIEILQGLKEGEEVVTQGSFDLKAELLKGTLGEQE
jgi:Cu(I)/Ag(I) efflux system membrane fusion protein